MGIRLLVAARKSRKGDASEDARYARQDGKVAASAERDGHTIVHTTHDTVSSQTQPWQRRELKSWMSDAAKLAMYDGILIAEADRLSRTDDEGWNAIESWCFANRKVIVTADGVMFPPRDDSDRYQWLALKRRARTYWEDVQSKHADVRRELLANGSAVGKMPFGYMTVGDKMAKRFVPNPDTAPLAVECFRRIARGESASLVAEWLGSVLGKPTRARRIIVNIIRNDAYFGRRDTHEFEVLADDMAELITTARARLDGRSFDRGGNRVTHAYSSRIYCECGANLNHHQSTRDGKPTGQAKYRCSRGRRGIAGESRCEFGSFPFDAANSAVESAVYGIAVGDAVVVTSGGDAARKAELDGIAKEIDRAVASRNMARVGELSARYAEVEAEPAAKIETRLVLTGKSVGERFAESDLDQRREILASGMFTAVVIADGSVRIEFNQELFDH